MPLFDALRRKVKGVRELTLRAGRHEGDAAEVATGKRATLRRMVAAGLPISDIIDVGIREQTLELIQVFPDRRQLLFEPVKQFFPIIAREYADIDHELYPMALSDEDGEFYLVSSSINVDGVPTHSTISDEAVEVDGQRVVGCDRIEVRRFDSLDIEVPENFLLKVDVDGKDLNVLKGFGPRLSKASAVVVEATVHNWMERLGFLAGAGFVLFDITDQAYYGPSLYQFDAVFVRQDLMTQELAPPISPFDPALWRE